MASPSLWRRNHLNRSAAAASVTLRKFFASRCFSISSNHNRFFHHHRRLNTIVFALKLIHLSCIKPAGRELCGGGHKPFFQWRNFYFLKREKSISRLILAKYFTSMQKRDTSRSLRP